MYRLLLVVAALLTAVDLSAQTGIPGSSQSEYYSENDGIFLAEIVKRSFEANGEIRIARLEVDKARARLVQAGLRPNPTLEVEQSSGSVPKPNLSFRPSLNLLLADQLSTCPPDRFRRIATEICCLVSRLACPCLIESKERKPKPQ